MHKKEICIGRKGAKDSEGKRKRYEGKTAQNRFKTIAWPGNL